jgi:nucleoside-diphosphate-sugar epimerase
MTFRIVITGATGYLCRALSKALIDTGHGVPGAGTIRIVEVPEIRAA